jgi:hypothetical protein
VHNPVVTAAVAGVQVEQSPVAAASSGHLVFRRRGTTLEKAIQKKGWRGRKHHHQLRAAILAQLQQREQQQQLQQSAVALAPLHRQKLSQPVKALHLHIQQQQQQQQSVLQRITPQVASPATSQASSDVSAASLAPELVLIKHRTGQHPHGQHLPVEQLQRQDLMQQQQKLLLLGEPGPPADAPRPSTATRFEAASLATKALLTLAAVHASPEVAQQLQQQLLQSMRQPTAHAAAAAGLDTAGELQLLLPGLQEDVIRACSKAAATRAADAALKQAGSTPHGSDAWCEAVAAAATAATAAALRITTLVEPVVTAVSDLYAAAVAANAPQQQLHVGGTASRTGSGQALRCLQQLVDAIACT